MSKMKVEVCETEEQAKARALILQQRGWHAEAPKPLEKVLWVNHCPGGVTDTGWDEDAEVWLVTTTR